MKESTIQTTLVVGGSVLVVGLIAVLGVSATSATLKVNDLTEQVQVLQTDNERVMTEKAEVEQQLDDMAYWEDQCFDAATSYRGSARELATSVQGWLAIFPDGELDLSEATALAEEGDATGCLG